MLGRLEPSWSHVGPILSHLRAILGLGSLYVGPSWGYLGPILGLCWAYVGPMLGRLGPSWRHVRPMLGHLRAILGLCWPYVYVENIFKDNFLRFFPPPKAKTVEKPTLF